MKKILFITLLTIVSTALRASIVIEAETMTLGGPYAGAISNPFNGVALYGNGDNGVKNVNFTDGDGEYTIKVTGASSNSSSAGVSLYIAGQKVAAFSFSGTSVSVQTTQKKLNFSSQPTEVKLLLETDNGSNDTYIDKIEFVFDKPIIERPDPVLPTQGAYYTGNYRNLIKEAGHTDADINNRLQMLWDKYFVNGNADNERLYYELGADEAYILDVNNNDVRSEGMSYGMMICVQMDKKAQFDKLWKFVKNRMQIQEGSKKGYIAWKCSKDGSSRDGNCAPDGDEVIAMALMFAAGRWGSGTGIYDYWKEANDILNNALQKDHYINSSTTNMFNDEAAQVVFVPYASSATHTDPSYHMPAFYALWSKWANYRRPIWEKFANKSREMYLKFANSTTGLMPDYANFDGTPTGSGHQEFRFDAWRCALHMGLDYEWFCGSENEVTIIGKLFDFFKKEGIESYGSEYQLNGKKLSSDHSPGLVACNAAGALACNNKVIWDILDNCQTASMTWGRYRYYDGMLYFLGYLAATGNFKIYKPAEVLDVAYDEQFQYVDNGENLLVDDYENVPEGYEYFMNMYDNNNASATVVTDPKSSSNHALHILPDNYDQFYYLHYILPKGQTLSGDFTQIEFDVYYDPSGDNNNQELKVCLGKNNNIIYKESTGPTSSHGVWKHVTAPISGSYGNDFKLFINVRTAHANFYIDNLKLKLKHPITPTSITEINSNDTKSSAVYNLRGQRVKAQSRGLIYIKGGKKFIAE
ncbi:MAG: hypothetical protein KBS94_07695 [Prevotella sp.]|nr:hypothetical protein [Candidatus Equicola faecalis]